MKVFFALVFGLVCVVRASAISIETVPVGDVGNANDPADGDSHTVGVQHFGAVGYAYNIGKYEVTLGQYTAFLNAVASTDTYGLYNTNMMTDLKIAGIIRTGDSGSYSYSVIGSPAHPATYVSWGDAARFSNWLDNGQPTGAQNATTTEDGAYTLNGATSNAALMAVTRNAGAQWFIPTENEWYKAAYYQPAAADGDSDGYWNYPMKTNGEPYSDQPPGATPDNTRVGNFYKDDGVVNGYDDGYAVTGSTTYSDGQNYLTDVGAYTSSPSYYGTFDQGGNVYEWNETKISSSRGVRGGAWLDFSYNGRAAFDRNSDFPATAFSVVGFRVASIPGAGGAGDFNGDGAVNATDYVLWRKNNGSQESYNTWQANFGQSSASDGVSVDAGVPEPPMLASLILTIGLLGFRRQDGRSTRQ
jgi:formylglycine-generating enzyme